jgi:hypothetical protein
VTNKHVCISLNVYICFFFLGQIVFLRPAIGADVLSETSDHL